MPAAAHNPSAQNDAGRDFADRKAAKSGAAELLSRPQRHTVLRSFAGHLDAAPHEVFAALIERMQGAPGIAVDAAGREIVQQGGWWYRGEYRVMAEPAEHDAASQSGIDSAAAAAASGTRLEFEIVNVAQSWHWAGPIAGRRVLAEAPYGFHALLSDVEAELAGSADAD